MDVHGLAVGDVALWGAALVALYRNRLPRVARSWPSWGRWAVVIATILLFAFATKVTIDPPSAQDHHAAVQWLILVSLAALVLLGFSATADVRRDRDNETKHQKMHEETREQNQRLLTEERERADHIRVEERERAEQRRAEDREAAERQRAEDRRDAERQLNTLMLTVRETISSSEQPRTVAVAPGSDEAEALTLASELLRMVNLHEVTDPFFPYYQMQRSQDPEVRERAKELMLRDLTLHYNHTFRMNGLYLHHYRKRVDDVLKRLLPKNNGGHLQMNLAVKNTLGLNEISIRQIAAYLRALAGGEVYDDAAHEQAEARATEHGITVAAIHKENHERYMREQRRERNDLSKRARDTVWKIEDLTVRLKGLAGRDKAVFALMHGLGLGMNADEPLQRILATGEPQRIIDEEQRKALMGFRRDVWDDLEPMLAEFAEFGVSGDKLRALANGGYCEYDDLDKIADELRAMNTALQNINLDD